MVSLISAPSLILASELPHVLRNLLMFVIGPTHLHGSHFVMAPPACSQNSEWSQRFNRVGTLLMFSMSRRSGKWACYLINTINLLLTAPSLGKIKCFQPCETLHTSKVRFFLSPRAKKQPVSYAYSSVASFESIPGRFILWLIIFVRLLTFCIIRGRHHHTKRNNLFLNLLN